MSAQENFYLETDPEMLKFMEVGCPDTRMTVEVATLLMDGLTKSSAACRQSLKEETRSPESLLNDVREVEFIFQITQDQVRQAKEDLALYESSMKQLGLVAMLSSIPPTA